MIIFTLLVIMIAFLLLFGLYIMKAIGLHTISNRQGFEYGWIAWIPIVNLALIPLLVENDVHEKIKGKALLLFIGLSIATVIPVIGSVTAIVLYIFNLYLFYTLVRKYSGSAPLHTVLYGLLAFTGAISLFFIRNNAVRNI